MFYALFCILMFGATCANSAASESKQASFESRLVALESRSEYLESRDLHHQAEIEALRSRDRRQQDELESLKSRDLAQQSEIENLKAELRLQKEKVATLEELVKDLATTQANIEDQDEASIHVEHESALEDEHQTQNSGIVQKYSNPASRRRRAENERPIAFYAELKKHALHAGINQNIVFENVVTNIGGAYSNSLGAFVAPVAGIYVFSTSILGLGSQTEHYTLNKNGQVVGIMYGHASTAPYPAVGLTAVLYLHQGDNVEVRTLDADGSAHGENYSSFAGFLLQQDFDSSMSVIGK